MKTVQRLGELNLESEGVSGFFPDLGTVEATVCTSATAVDTEHGGFTL